MSGLPHTHSTPTEGLGKNKTNKIPMKHILTIIAVAVSFTFGACCTQKPADKCSKPGGTCCAKKK